MTTHRIEEFARQFPENGLKLLLQQPLNVRDLLRIARYPHTNAIDRRREGRQRLRSGVGPPSK